VSDYILLLSPVIRFDCFCFWLFAISQKSKRDGPIDFFPNDSTCVRQWFSGQCRKSALYEIQNRTKIPARPMTKTIIELVGFTCCHGPIIPDSHICVWASNELFKSNNHIVRRFRLSKVDANEQNSFFAIMAHYQWNCWSPQMWASVSPRWDRISTISLSFPITKWSIPESQSGLVHAMNTWSRREKGRNRWFSFRDPIKRLSLPSCLDTNTTWAS
jgi:hypothetical protein